MLDLDLLNNTEQWEQHCEQQKLTHGTDIKTVWNGVLDIDVDSPVLESQSHYADVHGTGVLAKEEVKPEGAVLERKTIDPESAVHRSIREQLGLCEARVSVNLQKPGMFIPNHLDKNRTLVKSLTSANKYHWDWLDIKRYFYFFEDQEPGQFVQMGPHYLKWKAGDMIKWPYYLSHATANASYKDRKMLSIVGV